MEPGYGVHEGERGVQQLIRATDAGAAAVGPVPARRYHPPHQSAIWSEESAKVEGATEDIRLLDERPVSQVRQLPVRDGCVRGHGTNGN